MSQEIQVTEIHKKKIIIGNRQQQKLQKYNFQKYINTNTRNTEVQSTQIHEYKLENYRNLTEIFGKTLIIDEILNYCGFFKVWVNF